MDNTFTLFHDAKAVLNFIPGKVTGAKAGTMRFIGTSDECAAEIDRLNLTPLPDPALASAKIARAGQIQRAYTASLAAGFTATAGVPPVTATLPGDLVTQARFAALITLWQDQESHAWDDAYAATVGDADAKTQASQAATVTFNAQAAPPVPDVHGVPVAATIGQLRRVLGVYGLACATAQFALQSKLAAIATATTVEEVGKV